MTLYFFMWYDFFNRGGYVVEQELMEEEYYEPMQIQTDEQTLSVYSYNILLSVSI